MKIRGVSFGPIWGASGLNGFFGEADQPEYCHHRLFRRLFKGFNFDGMTFVAKTTPLDKREGHMRLSGYLPIDRKPDCVVVKPIAGVMLNAVGLSSPGAEFLFETGKWQARTRPFLLSFMAVKETRGKRLDEFRAYLRLLEYYLKDFRAEIGLQINLSCPNVGHDLRELLEEAEMMLDLVQSLYIPVFVKVNALMPPEQVVDRIACHEACDGICVSNTIPWGALSEVIHWKRLFRTDVSPLARYGGGGLSGRPLLPIVANWVGMTRSLGLKKHVNAGGGILHPRDVRVLREAGADSVFIGSVATLRPWRVQNIISQAYFEFGRE